MKDYREDRGRPFLGIHSERTRGNKHKLPQRKSQIDIRKIYHHDSDKTVEQVAQKGWGVSILVSLQDLTEEGPEQQTYLERAVVPNDLEKSLPICFIILCFYETELL